MLEHNKVTSKDSSVTTYFPSCHLLSQGCSLEDSKTQQLTPDPERVLHGADPCRLILGQQKIARAGISCVTLDKSHALSGLP